MKRLLYISTVVCLLAIGCSTSDLPNRLSDLPVLYHNTRYNFTFCLPTSWQGYSVLIQQWQGETYSPVRDAAAMTEHGPAIVLRNPNWKADAPCLDIPIMVFSRSQWQAEHQGKFSVGAGGIEEEITHTSKYVFAISSRFNADDSVGAWKEASEVVEHNQAANAPHLYEE
jgi:hypothetical protein